MQPKWCGCRPYPTSPDLLMGAPSYEVLLAEGPARVLDRELAEDLLVRFELRFTDDGPPVAPCLIRRIETGGIETAVEVEEQWAPLPVEALAALG